MSVYLGGLVPFPLRSIHLYGTVEGGRREWGEGGGREGRGGRGEGGGGGMCHPCFR